jgi:hypothetical protein
MSMRAILGLVAMLPAAFNPSPPARAQAVTVALCSGGTIEIPVNQGPQGPAEDAPCCVKACHTGQSRKRAGACH